MTTAIRHRQRAGRFGREVRGDDAQTADTPTTMQADGAEARCDLPEYEVDADAVAGAIISRLLAGGTIRPR